MTQLRNRSSSAFISKKQFRNCRESGDCAFIAGPPEQSGAGDRPWRLQRPNQWISSCTVRRFSRPPECEWKRGQWRLSIVSGELLRIVWRIVWRTESKLGALPPNPRDFSLCAKIPGSGPALSSARRIPAAGSALGVRPRRALSSAQVASAYQKRPPKRCAGIRSTAKNKGKYATAY